MLRKKKLIITVVAAVLMMLVSVGLTLAYITASSRPVINTFTVGNVELTLSETTGEQYPLVPGVALAKDPTLTVHAGSDACWLFFTAEEDANLKQFVNYEIAEGWTPLDGHTNVYYRRVPAAYSNLSFAILKDNTVQVKNTVTEENLASLQKAPVLKFTGYAIQQIGVATAQEAWQGLKDKEVTDR